MAIGHSCLAELEIGGSNVVPAGLEARPPLSFISFLLCPSAWDKKS